MTEKQFLQFNSNHITGKKIYGTNKGITDAQILFSSLDGTETLLLVSSGGQLYGSQINLS